MTSKHQIAGKCGNAL